MATGISRKKWKGEAKHSHAEELPPVDPRAEAFLTYPGKASVERILSVKPAKPLEVWRGTPLSEVCFNRLYYGDNLSILAGLRYKKVPVRAPGVRNGKTGDPWRGTMPPPGKHWQYTPDKLDELDANGEIYWSPNGNPRRKVYLDQSEGVPVQDIWVEFRDAHNQMIEITGYPTKKTRGYSHASFGHDQTRAIWCLTVSRAPVRHWRFLLS